MSMLGIGLGGFMKGFSEAEKLKDDEADRKLKADRNDRQKVLDARQDVEYDREKSNRDAVDKINADAQTNFNSQVQAGTQKAGDYDTFWSNYALPKLKQTYLAQGDIENAKRVQEWGDSEDTKAGAKFAMGAMFKASNGDLDGALDDAVSAGKIKGYIDHGYEVLGHQTVVGPDGTKLGYRIRAKTPDGKEVTQDLPSADVARLLATYLNPQNAWQTQLDAQKQKSDDAHDLKIYGAKKAIDQAYGTGDQTMRTKAIETLRKRMDGGIDGTGQKFDDLPGPDRESAIRQEVQLQQGQPGIGAAPAGQAPVAVAPGSAGSSATGPASGAPPQSVLFNNKTGEIRPAPPAPTAAPIAAPPVQNAGAAPAPTQQPPPASRQDNVSYQLQNADDAVQQGQNPDSVAADLRNNGISEDQWPGSLRTALARQQQQQGSTGNPYAVGLGQ